MELLSDIPGRLAPKAEVQAFSPNGGKVGTLRVRSRRPFKDAHLVRFESVEDRDAAEALRGVTLEIDRSLVPPAAEGSYYIFELVGCRCFDRTEGELGEIVRLSEDGGGHLLWVHDGKQELPIPLVNDFLVEVNTAAGRIDLDLPPGLVEICRA